MDSILQSGTLPEDKPEAVAAMAAINNHPYEIQLPRKATAAGAKFSLSKLSATVSRQVFYRYLSRREQPWKYQILADAMREIHDEDVCNDTCRRKRMNHRPREHDC